ncbi:MAG: hypothetical protein ACREBU_06150 [Nitrososphaera sp.]
MTKADNKQLIVIRFDVDGSIKDIQNCAKQPFTGINFLMYATNAMATKK